jgi:hypothetical protein
MQYSIEPVQGHDVWSAGMEQYLSLWEILNTNFDFWLTVTFASIVAIHALGRRVTIRLELIVGFLYVSFSAYTFIQREIILDQIYGAVDRAASGANAIGLELSPNAWADVGLVSHQFLFFTGTFVTAVFILRAHKRYAGETAS